MRDEARQSIEKNRELLRELGSASDRMMEHEDLRERLEETLAEHQLDTLRGCCLCGFCVCSPQHIGAMLRPLIESELSLAHAQAMAQAAQCAHDFIQIADFSLQSTLARMVRDELTSLSPDHGSSLAAKLLEARLEELKRASEREDGKLYVSPPPTYFMKRIADLEAKLAKAKEGK